MGEYGVTRPWSVMLAVEGRVRSRLVSPQRTKKYLTRMGQQVDYLAKLTAWFRPSYTACTSLWRDVGWEVSFLR